MRKFFKYLLRTLLVVVILLLLLLFLVYLPVVQRYGKNKAVEYVEAHLGLKAGIGRFSLKFPLRLEMDEVFAGKSFSDTLLYAGRLRLDVGLSGIFHKELSVKQLFLERVKFHQSDTATGMQLKLDVDSIGLEVPLISLGKKRADIRRAILGGGEVWLAGGKEKAEKDTVKKTFDWTFTLEQLEIAKVRYQMSTESLPFLLAEVGDGKIGGGTVDIGGQFIRVDSVVIREGICRMKTATGKQTEVVGEVKEVADSSAGWVVEAGMAKVADYAFTMEPEQGPGFELNLSNIGIRLDSVYNRGMVIKASLKDIEVVRQEGGEIDSMRADIDAEKQRTALSGVYIRTPYSVVRLDARAEGGIGEIIREVPLRLKLEADIGMQDVALFWPEMPEAIRKKTVKVSSAVSYQRDRVNIGRLLAAMPGNFRIEASGEVSSLQNLKAVSGNIALKGSVADASFAESLLKGKFALPPDLNFTLNAQAERGWIRPEFHLCEEGGCLSVGGEYGLPIQKYDLRLKADSFPLAAFFPGDSIGRLTAEVNVKGQGIQLGKMQAHLTADIAAAEFRHHLYTGIRFGAIIADAHLDAELKSSDPDLLLDLKLEADSVDRQYNFRLTGGVERADLKALHLMADQLGVSLNMDVQASIGPGENYFLNADFREVVMDNGRGLQNLGGAAIQMNSSLRHTWLDVTSGDFRLHFEGDTVITRLSSMFGAVAGDIRQQVAHRKLNMEEVKHLLPRFSLKVEGHTDNVIGKYLKARNIVFKDIRLNADASPEKGVYLAAEVIHPVFGQIGLDSVTLRMEQKAGGVIYDVNVMSGGEDMKDLYHIEVEGKVEQNELLVNFHQQNRDKEIGVNIGAAVILQDSSVMVRLSPAAPMLGYGTWALNEQNYIIFYPDHRIEADLHLSGGNRLLSVRSFKEEDGADGLRVEINGIDLSAVSRSIPFVPDIGGILKTDLVLSLEKKHFQAKGSLDIDSFSYDNKRIGDLGLDLSYDIGNELTRHTVDFTLHLDGVKRVLAQGAFSASPQNRDVDLRMDIPSLPLRLINVFVPERLLLLQGDLHGGVRLGGTLDQPAVDGRLAFRDASVEIVMLGTRFGIDSAFIPVNAGKINFGNFGITAPNKKRLVINGDVILVPFDAMRCDLSVEARNFQVVDVKENMSSLVYGKAYVDLNIGVKGPFSALNLTGDVNLLNATALNYVLRNSSPELKDHAVDLVRFVSFADSTLTMKDDLTNRINTGSFSMKLLVEIGEAVSMNIDLSEDGNNRVSLQGGGNLIFAMNPESGNNLVGKYSLSGGMVRYNVPVVGEKNFTIQSGSFVEWTGNLMNPMLHITASESVRVSVTEDNQSSRIVNFEVMIRIEGNLEQPRVTFDLSAPSDQTIQAQLTAFSAEERTKQAMNLLIYGTYSGPGTVNTGTNANNTLNNFVEKELNQWTRKYLKNASLTFGIDSYNQIGAEGQEVKRTDYSYQFSKQLFNDKINVKVGGRISSDNDPGSSMEENLIDDIAIEYMFTKKRDLYLKVFRHTNYESVLEGEVTQTGVGIVWRKSFRKVRDIFKKVKK